VVITNVFSNEHFGRFVIELEFFLFYFILFYFIVCVCVKRGCKGM
jgi:hypothetical protein